MEDPSLPTSTLRFVVHGPNGSYVKHGLDTQEASLKAADGPGSPNYGTNPIEGELTAADGEVIVFERTRQLRSVHQELLRAIRDGTPPPVSGEAGLAVMRIIEAAGRSAESRRTVDFDVP